MSWIDLKTRKPTKADANKDGLVLWLRIGGYCFSYDWNMRHDDYVAWMPIPEYVPLPKPPEGYRIIDPETEPFQPEALWYSKHAKSWQPALNLSSYSGSGFYAVPIKQYRPFKNAEEFRPFQHLWWRVKGESRHYPQRAYNDEGTLNTWQYMFENCEFQDGQPFGVRVDDTK